MTTQFFLTRNGILAANKESIVFLTNSGEFVRNCSIDEFDYLTKQVGLVEITRASGSTFPLFEIPKTTKWHFIESVKVVQDDSNYRQGTSCNGGDYSFTTTRDFFARNMGGNWQFAFIDWMQTSAEFGYDEISGQFQNDIVHLYLEDCYNHNGYQVRAERLDEDGFWDDQYQVVEKLATMTSFEEMMATSFKYIPSRYDDEGEGYEGAALSHEAKEKIIDTLKQVGWQPETLEQKQGRRGHGSEGMSKGRRR